VEVLLLMSALLVPFWLLTFAKAARAVRRRTDEWVTADDQPALPTPAPKVSILVAARNEEANVGACIASLCAQTYPSFEIIVVDDRSEDRTFEIAGATGDEHVRVLRAHELPEGWHGKPHALHLAAQNATGEWLLLTDADTVHRERSVANGIAFASSKGVEAISLLGEMVHPTLISNLVTPQLYAILAAMLERKKRKGLDSSETWGASGGYFLMTRAAFDRAGGMERVRHQIAEDKALARELHRSGTKYAFGLGAPALWRTTSYRTLAEIDRGFARNDYFRGIGAAKALGLTLLLWILALTPTATLLGTLVSWSDLSRAAAVFGVVQYVLVLSVQAYVRAISKTRWYLAPLAPVGALLAWVLLMRWSFGGAPIEWKGRTYTE
jgi:chlorobactene glucosyltransferase